MREPFPPGATASELEPPLQPKPHLWRWTELLLYALRQALCPLPPLSQLLNATAQGQLHLADSPRQNRRPQVEGLAPLLRKWILG